MNESANDIDIRIAPAGKGIDWLLGSFTIFSENWPAWVGVIVFIFVLKIISMFIFIVGGMVLQVMLPVFIGGLMLGCRSADNGEGFLFEHLFAGFSNSFLRLAAVGMVVLIGEGLIMAICGLSLFLVIGSLDTFMQILHTLQRAVMEQNISQLIQVLSGMSVTILLVTLIGLALYVPLLVLAWFAPALIVLAGQDAITAMKNSFIGCLKNWVPYLVYGVVGLILSIIATIPLALGWVVLMPMMIISVYLAYEDIYPQSPT